MSLTPKFVNHNEPLWQDKEVKFDSPLIELKLRAGEKIIENLKNVEDSKGNAGEDGKMMVTNLRLIWQSVSKPRINLSIGLGCISSISSRTVHTKLRGKQDSLYMMVKVNSTRYEFIFTHHGNALALVQLVTQVCRAFSSTKIFRDLKLRSNVISSHGKQLKIVESEQIYNKINGVWNLSSDQGNLGTMYLTNIRVVWHANMNELFNISLPYLQISGIKVRESKFGVALVIESSESSGGYVLGFRIDPNERMNAVFNEMINLYNIHSTHPNLGVESYLKEMPALMITSGQTDSLIGSANDSGMTDENECDQNHDHQDTIAAYLTDDGNETDRNSQIVYSPQLGLAIEKIKDGFTLESLWNVIPQN